MAEISTFDVGEIGDEEGRLIVRYLSAESAAYLHFYCFDPSDARKRPISFIASVNQLKALTEKAIGVQKKAARPPRTPKKEIVSDDKKAKAMIDQAKEYLATGDRETAISILRDLILKQANV